MNIPFEYCASRDFEYGSEPRIARITRIRKYDRMFFHPCYPCNPWLNSSPSNRSQVAMPGSTPVASMLGNPLDRPLLDKSLSPDYIWLCG